MQIAVKHMISDIDDYIHLQMDYTLSNHDSYTVLLYRD